MFLEEKEYNHVIDLIENRIEPSPLLSDFGEWFYDKYKVKLYAYLCDTTITELTRLRAVLFDHEDSRKFHNGANLDKKYQREIADKFSELSIKYKCNLEYQNPKNVFVCY